MSRLFPLNTLSIKRYKRPFFSVIALMLLPSLACSLEPAIADQINWDQRNKAEQQEIKNRLSDTERPAQLPTGLDTEHPPIEVACFNIKSIDIIDGFLALPENFNQNYIGQCLGKKGITQYLRLLNKQLLAEGYITARAVLPEQDLSTGQLKIKILSGAIDQIIFPESYTAYWDHALPFKKGESLNIRDMEQGIDQLNRLASQDVKFDVEPGRELGTSKIVANVTEKRPWTAGLSIDDGGSESTGVHQVSANASLSNMLRIQDVVSLSATRDLDDNSADSSRSYRIALSVPLGYWLFDFSANGSEYEQLVSGAVLDFISTGGSNDEGIKVTYVGYRDNKSKASIYGNVRKRTRRGYINDTEVEVQRRNLTDVELGVLYRRYINRSVLDLSLAATKGIDWLHAEKKSETSGSETPQPNYQYFTASAVFSGTLEGFAYPLQFNSQLQMQWADTAIYSLDWFSNGGRYTIRGFSPKHTQGAEHGWRSKNDFTLPFKKLPVSVYMGIDLGGVSGAGSVQGDEDVIAGITFGLRGKIAQMNYEAFVSRPLILNGTEKNNCCQIGGKISWQY
jgi:hemolysin activation/secretion protein